MRASVKTLIVCILMLMCAITSSAFQQSTRQSLEAKKKEVSTLESSLNENKKKHTELESQLKSVTQEIQAQEEALVAIKDEISSEEEEVAFLESPARTVLDVTSATTFLIDFNGNRRYVTLDGVVVDPSKDEAIAKSFKKALAKKQVFVRCADTACNKVYLYGNKTISSLNAEMLRRGLATVAPDARYDAAAFLPNSSQPGTNTSSPSTYESSSSSSTAGTDVHVKGYYRKDGTYVRPHTRSAPGTKSGSSSGRARRP